MRRIIGEKYMRTNTQARQTGVSNCKLLEVRPRCASGRYKLQHIGDVSSVAHQFQLNDSKRSHSATLSPHARIACTKVERELECVRAPACVWLAV